MINASRCSRLLLLATAACVASSVQAQAPAWKAGVAAVKVTPPTSMWMAGYAARTKPSEGVASDLYCKALALEAADGKRFVFVTCDLIGIPRGLREAMESAVAERFKLPPESLLLNASHTHCGPEFRVKSYVVGDDEDRAKQAHAYGDDLRGKLVELVGRALAELAPAKLTYVKARCGFAMNRRTPTGETYKNSPWSDGPVDHDVPVLKVTALEDGELRAVLFGYACHNTTIGFYQFCADYAGFAQQYIEEKHPGATALFLMGCGGDQNPYPRGELELSRQHGRSLATAVEAALGSSPAIELTPTLTAALKRVTLEFAEPKPKAMLERELQSPNKYEASHARRLLDQLKENGKIETRYDCPLQLVQIGSLTLAAFPGETVVDYSLRTKRELGAAGPVWVAGYSNDVFGYIPSKRVLLEGGYEGGGAFIYGSFPGPFAVDVEDRLMTAMEELRTKISTDRPSKASP
jgi:neutral ceramidase